jgi:hypothetical protein
MNRKLAAVLMAALRVAAAQAATESDLKLLGRWTAGRVSTIQYQDAMTGRAAPTNGNSFAYEFREDGTYSFTGLMQSVVYQCTTTMFSNETGTYTVNGSIVSLRPEKNPYKMTNSCAPSSNREAAGKLVNRTLQVRTYRDGQWMRMELKDEAGAVQTFSASSHK